MSLSVYLNQDGAKEIGAFQPVTHTTTSAEATANVQVITVDDLPSVEHFIVQIYRAGTEVGQLGVVVTTSENVITLTDGGTYAATAGDVVHMLVAGKVTE